MSLFRIYGLPVLDESSMAIIVAMFLCLKWPYQVLEIAFATLLTMFWIFLSFCSLFFDVC